MEIKKCVYCDKELENKKRKYCDDKCKYWFKRSEMSQKGWGSKNSQMRLDKKAINFAKKMQSGKTGVRYW